MFDLLSGSVPVSEGTIRLKGRDVTRDPRTGGWRRAWPHLPDSAAVSRPDADPKPAGGAAAPDRRAAVWANFLSPRRIAAEERAARDKARATCWS
jgi:branched-chain amino acid transport system ATP-binding protein